MVSRRHAQFRNENGRFVVEDLGSSNGTHLNNVRVQKQAIGHADIIQCRPTDIHAEADSRGNTHAPSGIRCTARSVNDRKL